MRSAIHLGIVILACLLLTPTEMVGAFSIGYVSPRLPTAQSATTAAASLSQTSQVDTPPKIRLNVPEKARTVCSVCTSGTLCTTSHTDSIEGAPFGSFVDYVLDDEGNPVLLMNEMSMHTLNIQKSPKDALVTLFAQLGGNTGTNPNGQDVSRVSVTGTISQIDSTSPDWDTIRMRYGISHSYADQVMDSPKFHFYRLSPLKIYFVGGFGVSSEWVETHQYKDATPDILAKDASSIVDRLNRHHVSDLLLTAEHILNVASVEKVRVTSVDRLGMDMRVTSRVPKRKNKVQTDEFRVGFRIPVISVEDAKSEVLKVFQEGWEKANGMEWGDGEVPGSDIPVVKFAEDSLM